MYRILTVSSRLLDEQSKSQENRISWLFSLKNNVIRLL